MTTIEQHESGITELKLQAGVTGKLLQTLADVLIKGLQPLYELQKEAKRLKAEYMSAGLESHSDAVFETVKAIEEAGEYCAKISQNLEPMGYPSEGGLTPETAALLEFLDLMITGDITGQPDWSDRLTNHAEAAGEYRISQWASRRCVPDIWTKEDIAILAVWRDAIRTEMMSE